MIGARHVWTWRQVHAASIALALRLPEACAVCNLCNSRVGFLVTWLAALRKHFLTILPPSGGHADLSAILKSVARVLVVVDGPQALQAPWREQADCLTYLPEWQASPDSAEPLAWQPAWDDIAVRLYTSGSSGAPEPQPKTLTQLATGALVLGERLDEEIDGGMKTIERIVCSVPPQHMFGVECSVMLSLVHAIPVLDRRPLLSADVRAAFADPALAAWIATPLHLRSLVQAGEALPNCSVVIASTMALAQPLARTTEALVGAPVLEIYGSTETGVLALRRTVRDASWRPVNGVRLESAAGATTARGTHFASPVALSDRIEIDASGRFSLLGRHADLVKIAGRRASLAGLDLLLQDVPGLEDGVFYLPDTGNPAERLCLIYCGPALDRAALLAWLRPRLDPAFLPRTVIRVERLPRADNGKLPRQALDRVVAQWRAALSQPSGPAAFEFAVASAHPALAGHFPGRPIVPGVLLLDRVMAALGRPVARVRQVKFAAALLPDETARVEFRADGERVAFTVEALRADASVLLASGSLVLG